jgi:3-dehydroquinate synthase
MDVFEQQLHVTFKYLVAFTAGVFDASNLLLRQLVSGQPDPSPARAVVVVDDGVAKAHSAILGCIERYAREHSDVILLAAPILTLPGGEAVKNDSCYVEAVHGAIHAGALCRHSYVIAVGGGAVLDVAGYAAATAHRGIRLIRVPTTVLSQADSGVGVKNGFNGFGRKNYFGTFAPPFAVVNDCSFLRTLADRDWLCGVSEAVKAAIVRDRRLFDDIEEHAPSLVARDDQTMQRVIRRTAMLHCAHIAGGGDPFELGTSRPLDFGHWSAHKLEYLSNHRVRHGEAVSIGIALDSTYAYLSGLLAEREFRRIVGLLSALHLPLDAVELHDRVDDAPDPRSILQGLAEFKEHLGGRLTITLPLTIGRVIEVNEVDPDLMVQSIRLLKSLRADQELPSAASPFIRCSQ